jgi:hypothetical protein
MRRQLFPDLPGQIALATEPGNAGRLPDDHRSDLRLVGR